MSGNSAKSLYMAKGGLLTAIGVILIYVSGIIPVNKAYLLAIASFIIPLSILITDIKNTFVVYICTSILSILLCGVKFTVITYILFFGLYGFAKFYIEKINKIVLEIILKLLFSNACAAILFLIYKLFFPGLFNLRFSLYLIIIGLQIAFILYDYVLTLIINFMDKRLSKKV
ncbi:MAG: hypothetical protein LKE46_13365 [Clostridium sp.]|uniref:hypothetical protein n=1 Tax=Clostridium sp. TaxID=1506 RepID=UPI0025C033A4|nr:hypothetical protein [Clostridium sp.]MCH3965248.1 hypothetical protein [Clostridium sp.]MCI1714468.1 hypothetical protein [Clostridium sp.]MCI1798730.1 hypothetical protein [Clostridium sp.]MCI1812539.1 hypothetical protein [Clostridium sp.]MCI1869540.1 hypothetical protein [Clostridium sp.]